MVITSCATTDWCAFVSMSGMFRQTVMYLFSSLSIVYGVRISHSSGYLEMMS